MDGGRLLTGSPFWVESRQIKTMFGDGPDARLWMEPEELRLTFGSPLNLNMVSRDKNFLIDIFIAVALVRMRCEYFQIVARRNSNSRIDGGKTKVDYGETR